MCGKKRIQNKWSASIRSHHLAVIIILAVLGIGNKLQAQISSGGTPKSFAEALPANIDSRTLPPVNVDSLRVADEAEQDKGLPPRFGVARSVDLGLNNAGTWHTLSDGSRLWRLRISAPAAASINLIYDQFWLPPGAEFFIYNQDKSHVLGAFTERNNKPYGRFSTAPVKGSVSILEYYEPANTDRPGVLHISKVIHGYRSIFKEENGLLKGPGGGGPDRLGLNDSGSCNNNVRCSVGNPWTVQRRSVAMILIADNTRDCSGSLVNNVKEDFTPYFLTAFHCADLDEDKTLSTEEKDDVEDWIFMFNYESVTCSNPSTEQNTGYTISGSTLRAGLFDSDFLLVEISSKPPMSYNAYFGGWSNVDTAPSSSVTIRYQWQR